ncbi:MAG: YebC/PmpR family DNA-binding transcriptional regulator [Deltaproteobacteria bacterium]|nr:YebC/PmpR family DNA-binding transcriptional regulator [Deltaproteobacteria bacterium]MBW2068056.1 YebC/PmpR family DNA-binding transcriptional regulator [Deltaproteobacteria bacterium]
MAGHSKWANIRHKKAVQDARRGKIFTKLIREIMVAARMGGGNPDNNPRLRAAIAAAKAENMPKENIERAIKKGTGELEGVSYEEITCEGYAPGGVAVLVEAMTDNRNRTISEIRHIFTKNGGSLGEAGCVAWMFNKKGLIVFPKDKYTEDELMEVALEAGAEDVRDQGDQFEVLTDPADFLKVKQVFDEHSMQYELAEISMIPQTVVKIEDPKQAQQVIRLMELLEDHDDVQHAYANFDIPDELLKSIAA